MSDNGAFMPTPPYAVTTAPLDLDALVRTVGAEAAADPVGPGAVITFVGVVRNANAGRRVLRLEYEGYEPLAVRAFERIGREVADRWKVRLAVHHRLGTLENRRGQRDHRGGVAAPRRRLRRLPLRHRAHQADRADLEARVLRGRRRLDRGGRPPTRTTSRRARPPSGWRRARASPRRGRPAEGNAAESRDAGARVPARRPPNARPAPGRRPTQRHAHQRPALRAATRPSWGRESCRGRFPTGPPSAPSGTG